VGPGASLALKLVLTPMLVGAASLAGRRWGSEIGGWLVGIPFTSGPIAFFLALNPGPRFAAATAAGILAGVASQAAFCLAYAWVAQRYGWAPSLLAGSAAFFIITTLLTFIVWPAPALFVAMIAVLAISLRLMPYSRGTPTLPLSRSDGEGNISYPRWDIPARMVVATAFVVVVTAAAPLLGPHLAGLLAPFPIYATVLATFAHRISGVAPAIGVLRGLLLGLFSFAGFFLMLAELLAGQGIVIAFAAAILVALAIQGLSLAFGRRLGLA
jgi:hypothetical protein